MASALRQVASVFIRLGITAFGGPAAHIALMRHEVVNKHNWMNDAEFLDMMGATNLIPGPNSTELAIHLGFKKAGWKGLVAAGALFILPAVLITGIIAWLYNKYGSLPLIEPFIYGIKPAIIAVILMAVYPLGKASVKNFELVLVSIAALIMSLAGLPEILVMFGLGALYAVYKIINKNRLNTFLPVAMAGYINNTELFFIFLKIGSILYGSGYVLFAYIDQELVLSGILSRQVLIDAIAVGQFTPGPVFSSVTFIGYQVNGFWGALVSTIGVFLPSFIFVGLLGKIVPLFKKYTILTNFLNAVNVISVAIIAAVCWQMGVESIVGWKTAIIFLISFLTLLVFPKINSAYIVLVGSGLGYILTLL